MTRVAIREARPGEPTVIRAVHDAAFGGPAEGALMELLERDGLVVASVVAADEASGEVVGHALCSALPVVTDTGDLPAAK